MAYEMKYQPKINPNAVITGYIGKSTAPAGQVHGYLQGGKKQG